MRFGGSGSEQTGWRPGVVFQNNVGNIHSPNIIALPLTSRVKKICQPTHVFIKASDAGIPKDSIVLCENPERMSKDRIGEYITTLSEDFIAKIAIANILASSAIAFIDKDTLIEVWRHAVSLNATFVA